MENCGNRDGGNLRARCFGKMESRITACVHPGNATRRVPRGAGRHGLPYFPPFLGYLRQTFVQIRNCDFSGYLFVIPQIRPIHVVLSNAAVYLGGG